MNISKEKFYTSFSRFTDPRQNIQLVEALPLDIPSLARILTNIMVHHNLLSYYGVSYEDRQRMTRAKSPNAAKMLSTLQTIEPYDLSGPRDVYQRLVGACLYESHLFSCLLRTKGYASRQRAGYFRDIRENQMHILKFWNHNMRGKRMNWDQFLEDPEEWFRQLDEYSQHSNQVNHRIEHWVVEYFNTEQSKWQILDANTDFLKAHSNISVGIHLPPQYFEFASNAWIKMRANDNFNPDQYYEEPQDGRSHIRSSLLWDFYSMLNHDAAGLDTEFKEDYIFVKKKPFKNLTQLELVELDNLAELMSNDPSVVDLVNFYKVSKTLKLQGIEHDTYCFINSIN